jgi:anaerobic selenocysteine-containing dehydrogenase
MSAGGFATGYTLGDNRIGMDPEGIADAQLVILWGANPLVTHHHLWKFVEAARSKGAHVVVIDPVRTRSADRADEHLAPRPGTDAALALGLLHVVVARGAEDREFIEAHTLGWDAFRERIHDYPPARVAEITGLPVERIEALGARLATARPTAIRIGPGMQRHAGGGMAVRTITCIPGVTGDWRYPGGGAAYDTRSFFKGNWPALWRDDLRPPGTRVLAMTRLAEALLTPSDQPVQALLVYGSNPAASAPDQRRVRQGLAREDLFTVVIDHFQTDTADFADLLLPATMQTEHADLHNSYGHAYLAWNAPAVAAPGECLSNSEIFRRLARVWNDRGEYLALVQTSDRVPPGIVGGAKGHWPKLNPGGTSIAATVMEKDADMGRGAVFHDNRVEVERAPMSREDFLQAFATLGHGRA